MPGTLFLIISVGYPASPNTFKALTMPVISVSKFLLISVFLLCGFNSYSDNSVPTQLSDVPYSAVTNLSFTQADHVQAYGDNPLQHGLLWLPEGENQQPYPLVIFIHGGCWLSAYDITHSQAFTSALAEHGVAVWSVEYRRTGDEGGGWPGTFEDIVAGINHTAQLSQFPVDLNNVSLVGHSAGGHLALLATRQNLSVPVKQVIGLAAITDINAYAEGDNSCQQATSQFMGGTPAAVKAKYQDANPANHPPTIKTVLLHGSEDTIVPLSQSYLSGADRFVVDGAGHFDWIHPQTPAFKQLIKTIKETE